MEQERTPPDSDGFYGGLDPACVGEMDSDGRFVKTAFTKGCLRGVDYVILVVYALLGLASIPIFCYVIWLKLSDDEDDDADDDDEN